MKKQKILSTDLFRSTFIAAELENLEFEDCNLKRVNFCHSVRENVMFQWSNEIEAQFEEEERSEARYLPIGQI
ncbi:hypothetical protein [Spirochaeta dissipatitropha]